MFAVLSIGFALMLSGPAYATADSGIIYDTDPDSGFGAKDTGLMFGTDTGRDSGLYDSGTPFVDGSTAADLTGEKGGSPAGGGCSHVPLSTSLGVAVGLAFFVRRKPWRG